MNPPADPSPTLPAADRCAVRLLGAGNAGINILKLLRSEEFPEVGLVALNSDSDSLGACGMNEKVLIPQTMLTEYDRGELERRELDAQSESIRKYCAGAKLIGVVAGLGGRAGTQLAQAVARVAREEGALTVAFVTLPFDCEGSLRFSKARQGLAQLHVAADLVFCLPNQELAREQDENASLTEAFSVPAKLMSGAIQMVLTAQRSKTIMGLGFEEICRMLKGRKADIAFAVAKADGKTRADEVAKALVAGPIIRGGRLLAECESVATLLLGGTDLSVGDVNHVMRSLKQHCPAAVQIMGAGADPAFEGTLGALLLAVTSQAGELQQMPRLSEPEPAEPYPEISASTFNLQCPPRARTFKRKSEMRIPPGDHSAKSGAHARRHGLRLRQAQLPLELVNKGRFEKSEPTIHKGEDLDVPTFIRRGISLN